MSYQPFKPSSERWRPRDYQKKALKFLLEHACGALFLRPGMGKTSATLAAIKVLKGQGIIKRVLLIAPLRPCYSVWPCEIAKWSDFHGLKVEILHGKDKDAALKRKADIYIINPEGLEWLMGAEKVQSAFTARKVIKVNGTRFRSFRFDTLIIDELSKFKHVNTVRFKIMKPVLNSFQRRWGLTGSPAPNGLIDLFGQCFMLDEGNALGKFITHFRSTYFTPSGFGGYDWKLQKDGASRIYERIAPLVLQMSAEDYLELPELTENVISVDIPAPVMVKYKELEDIFISEMEDMKVVTAANAAVASMKCRQVACGGIYLDPADKVNLQTGKNAPREWLNLHKAKIEALSDLVDELQGEPLLVAYEFQHDLDRLRAHFGKNTPVIGSGTGMSETTRIIEKWNKGEIPLLFGQPQSMAHGLNLQGAAKHVCWHSLTWDYELYDQFIKRVHRQGNKAERVIVHHIIARGTIDEVIFRTLKAKAKGQDALFEALKTYRLKKEAGCG